jgi:hypothetical protein
MSTEQDHDVKFQMIKPKRLKGRFQKKSNIISFNRVIDIGSMSSNPFFRESNCHINMFRFFEKISVC